MIIKKYKNDGKFDKRDKKSERVYDTTMTKKVKVKLKTFGHQLKHKRECTAARLPRL